MQYVSIKILGNLTNNGTFFEIIRHNSKDTDTVQKTYINVDEEGIEAAAATGIGMATSSLPPEPVIVEFNKPFTFIICDDTNNQVLFIGSYFSCE